MTSFFQISFHLLKAIFRHNTHLVLLNTGKIQNDAERAKASHNDAERARATHNDPERSIMTQSHCQ